MGGPRSKLELVIPSDFKYLGAVDAAFQDLAREFSCDKNWINDFSAALIEACSNAIEHGNKYAKEKTVSITVKMNGKEMVAQICDQGEGFEYKEFLSDDSPPDPLSERGRGIMIMRAFCNEMKYTAGPTGGLCIELTKICSE